MCGYGGQVTDMVAPEGEEGEEEEEEEGHEV